MVYGLCYLSSLKSPKFDCPFVKCKHTFTARKSTQNARSKDPKDQFWFLVPKRQKLRIADCASKLPEWELI